MKPHEHVSVPGPTDKRLKLLVGLSSHEIDSRLQRDLGEATSRAAANHRPLGAEAAAGRVAMLIQRELLDRAFAQIRTSSPAR